MQNRLFLHFYHTTPVYHLDENHEVDKIDRYIDICTHITKEQIHNPKQNHHNIYINKPKRGCCIFLPKNTILSWRRNTTNFYHTRQFQSQQQQLTTTTTVLSNFISIQQNTNMSIEADRRFTILSSHLNPTRLTSDPPSFSLSVCSDSQKRLDDCVFCNIIRGQSPALKVYEDDMCLCILDTNPLSHGHSLIIPKSHFPSLDVTPPSVVAAMCSKVPFISNAIMKATGCNSFNLLVNNGVAAGQVIFHTHIHIIPRKAYDCLWASESLLRRPLNLDDEKASELIASIQQHLLVSNICQESKTEDFCSSKN